jgi:hypothetical protein
MNTPAPPTSRPRRAIEHTARIMLASFLLTFLIARIIVLLIMTRRIPDLYLYMGQTHVHHLNYGIFLLTAVGAYLLFFPELRPRAWIVALFGVGLALTFDEFGMWLHLGGPYWQRASFDAVVVIAATLGLLTVAPAVWRMRPRQWVTATLSVLLLAAFTWLTIWQWRALAHRTLPKVQQIEQSGPP